MTRRPTTDDGMSLVELLVVLAVLALVTALVLPSARPTARAMELETLTDDLAARLREARTRAIAKGVPVHVDFDVGGKRYAVGGDRRAVQWPQDLEVSLTTGRSAVTDLGGARVTWFADGSASGGTVRIARAGRSATVTVDWLTGGVGIARSP